MFNRTNLITALVFVAIAVAFLFPESGLNSFLNGSSPASVSTNSGDIIVENVKIYDMDGRLAYEGNVNLTPELARIVAGERDSHSNDGSVFGNREGLLPQQDRGYYREYVVRTPSINHAGPQRLVIGEGNEVYYTPDHYESFIRIE